MNDAELREKAIEARKAYQREWRRKNPDKVRANNERYWLKKATAMLEARNAERDA